MPRVLQALRSLLLMSATSIQSNDSLYMYACINVCVFMFAYMSCYDVSPKYLS
jgi:hypothetical protein